MVSEKDNNKDQDKKLLLYKELPHDIKPISEGKNVSVQTTNVPVTNSTKMSTSKVFETVEGIILKLADKIVADNSSKKDKQSTENVKKTEIADIIKKSNVSVKSTRKPVSVYLAPIDNFKNESIKETQDENIQNFDINLSNDILQVPVNKTQSYENLNLGTPKGKKKTVIIPISNTDLTNSSSIKSVNTNKKSNKFNSDGYKDISISKLSRKKKSKKENSQCATPNCKKMLVSSTNQCLSSGSTQTALEILTNKHEKSVLMIGNKDNVKSFVDACKGKCKKCTECSSSKGLNKSKNRKKNIIINKSTTGTKEANQYISVVKMDTKFEIPKTPKSSKANQFINIQSVSPLNENNNHLYGNIYTVAPTRNRNRNIDNDSGIDNPQFNDDLSMVPYTCKVTTDKNNFNLLTKNSFHKANTMLVPLKNHTVKNDSLNINEDNKKDIVQIKSPKIARFYDMQQNINTIKQNKNCEKNNSTNDLIVKTAQSLSPFDNKTISSTNSKLLNRKSIQSTFSTASNGGVDDLSYLTDKTSNMAFDTAVANESDDIITDSFVPCSSKSSLEKQPKIYKHNTESKSNELKCTTENFSSEMKVVLNDNKGNRITVNMTNIIKSFSNNNESLSPDEIYIDGNQIWKKQ
uniref:BRCT domain-containing protein n=1 Tax=Strongyloides venezuelensis TaxID=75913 RepID=A0A0K0F8S3_STRVS